MSAAGKPVLTLEFYTRNDDGGCYEVSEQGVEHILRYPRGTARLDLTVYQKDSLFMCQWYRHVCSQGKPIFEDGKCVTTVKRESFRPITVDFQSVIGNLKLALLNNTFASEWKSGPYRRQKQTYWLNITHQMSSQEPAYFHQLLQWFEGRYDKPHQPLIYDLIRNEGPYLSSDELKELAALRHSTATPKHISAALIDKLKKFVMYTQLFTTDEFRTYLQLKRKEVAIQSDLLRFQQTVAGPERNCPLVNFSCVICQPLPPPLKILPINGLNQGGSSGSASMVLTSDWEDNLEVFSLELSLEHNDRSWLTGVKSLLKQYAPLEAGLESALNIADRACDGKATAVELRTVERYERVMNRFQDLVITWIYTECSDLNNPMVVSLLEIVENRECCDPSDKPAPRIVEMLNMLLNERDGSDL